MTRSEALGDRQHGDEHGDDAGEADDRDRRRAEALPEAAQVHRGDGQRL